MEKNGKPLGQEHKQAQEGAEFPDQDQPILSASADLADHMVKQAWDRLQGAKPARKLSDK